MKLTILGSGTTIPSKTRSAPAYLLEVSDKIILLDSGEGAKRRLAEAGKNLFNLDYIFYTHTHIDHVAELPAILWASNVIQPPRAKELVIFGPRGFKKFFKKMLAAFWPQFEKDASFRTEIRELESGEIKIGDLKIKAVSLDRQEETLVRESIGYRIEYQGKSLVWTGDVGYNKNVVRLAEGADILLIDSAVSVATNGHLTPFQAGELAGQAKVKKLVLTHFYPVVEKIDAVSEASKNFKGEIVKAEDLMEIEI